MEGERIRGSHLARAHPAFATIPADTNVAAAPLPGSRRLLTEADLHRLARRLLADGQRPARWEAPVCFEYTTTKLESSQLAAAMARRFPPPATIAVTSFTQFPVPPGDIEFPGQNARSIRPDKADGTTLIRGWVHYGERRRHPIWVRIRVSSHKLKPVAAEALAPGAKVAETQIRMVPAEGWLIADPPSAGDIVGLEPRRVLPAGTALHPALFRPPSDIRRGDTIRVTAMVGSAKVELETRAESSARRGERIVVKNHHSGQRFLARVEGPGRAIALGTGDGK
jgi:flagella basal body P-ring formation protein FlgA